MKKLLLTAIAASAAAVTYGQGTIFINNLDNTGVVGGNGGTVANPTYSAAVTSNGLIFTADTTSQAGNLGGTAGSTLIGNDFSWALYGGATDSSSALTLLASATGSAITGDNANWGQFLGESTQVAVTGRRPVRPCIWSCTCGKATPSPLMLLLQPVVITSVTPACLRTALVAVQTLLLR